MSGRHARRYNKWREMRTFDPNYRPRHRQLTVSEALALFASPFGQGVPNA